MTCFTRCWCGLFLMSLCFGTWAVPTRGDEPVTLTNRHIVASFDAHGLTSITSTASGQLLRLQDDSATLTIDGEKLAIPGLPLTQTQRQGQEVIYTYRAGSRTVRVRYELQTDWNFLSKRITVVLPEGESCRVESLDVLSAELKPTIAQEYRAHRATGSVFLRFPATTKLGPGGAFLALQNPFLDFRRNEQRVSVAYAPDLPWRAEYGAFDSDRVCLGIYELTGQESPAHGLEEWRHVPNPQQAFDRAPRLDRAELDALTRCVEAFQLFRPQQSVRVHVPWCENDYQIDVGTAEGRAEYRRIIDQAAAVGCHHMLFTPGNSEVSSLAENADAWAWENVLWLGLGQKIRKDEWDIARDPIPQSVQEMLDYARTKEIQFVAYVYPTLGWKQNPEWTAWCQGKTGGYVGVDTGVRSFQDWFVDQLVAFHHRTGISGFSFDHWWIAYEAKEGLTPTSQYAQWYGCRRILEELQRRIPEVIIDGRQQYQWFGPWTWLGGTYPHPTMTDEQPGSFENFPDLHFSRVSGDRQRWAAWWYRHEQFTPLDLLPGYMTHQTPRNDAQGQCVRDRAFFTRDWDLLGWRYSVLSSVGTAPFNHVVDCLPARDESEFKSFTAADQQWLRHWMDWSDQHRELLRQLRSIIGPPAIGRIDGTAAIAGDRGFIFLFNPNYRALDATFLLNESIGVTSGERFVLRELYPCEGRLLGKPTEGMWQRGNSVTLRIKGPQVMVLELLPATDVSLPALLNAKGKAELRDGVLTLSDVLGEVGTSTELTVLLPAGQSVEVVAVNGKPAAVFALQDDVVTVPVTFSGIRFEHCQQVSLQEGEARDGKMHGEFVIPQRVFDQLAARAEAWPVPYTADDLLATWRGSHRLLLYVHLADPQDTWNVTLKINGRTAELKKAYSDVYPLGRERTFTGFYADVTHLRPDQTYDVELTLPDGLQPGQFHGLFFENVETEHTTETQ